jgi:hypothetical protein
MAAKKKTEEIVEPSTDLIEVELTEQYIGITSVISKGVIEFVDNKAMVSQDTAESLRLQGFVK